MNIHSHVKERRSLFTQTKKTDGDVCEIEFVDARKVKRVAKQMISGEATTLLAETFKILGDPTRTRVAYALSREELCVCDLANLLGVSQSVVSHSLRSLRHMKLVKHRKEGKTVYYSLDDEHILNLLEVGLRHVEEQL